MTVVPPFVDECGCGPTKKESDGISNKYICTGCGTLLADLTVGAGD